MNLYLYEKFSEMTEGELLEVYSHLKKIVRDKKLIQVFGDKLTIREKEVNLFIFGNREALAVVDNKEESCQLTRNPIYNKDGYGEMRAAWYSEVVTLLETVTGIELTEKERNAIKDSIFIFEQCTYQLI